MAVIETVGHLVGRAALAVRNTEQIFHLPGVKVGHTPGTNLSRFAKLFEGCDHAGEFRAWNRPMEQVKIQMIGAETSEARLASTGDAISSHFITFHLGDQEYLVAPTGNRLTDELLGAATA